jgi:hypothetical protein
MVAGRIRQVADIWSQIAYANGDRVYGIHKNVDGEDEMHVAVWA